jgi:phosphoribosylamine--glycine ligase
VRDTTDILVVGNGAREHALAWSLRREEGVGRVYAAPGNAGMAEVAECLGPMAEEALVAWAGAHVSLVVIGPEAPLAAGLADRLRQAGIPVVGPGRDAARIESSKAYAKRLMAKAGIPTARFTVVSSFEEGRARLRDFDTEQGVVVKADGLAAGKGVVVAASRAEAEAALAALFVERRWQDAGRIGVLEERLSGVEMSVMVLTDGTRFRWLPPARDYKRLRDGDEGPNTGGMGSVAPHPAWTPALADAIADRIIEPMLAALSREGHPFRGILYAGLMLTAAGPMVLEWNARLGDPEATVMLPLIQGDWVGHLRGAAEGRLPDTPLTAAGAAVGVVLAAPGYPDRPEAGIPLTIPPDPDALVFHAATARRADGTLVNTGGRSLCVVGRGRDIAEARHQAYRMVDRISFPAASVRRDIGSTDSHS